MERGNPEHRHNGRVAHGELTGSDLLPRDADWTPVTTGESGATVLHDRRRGHYAKLVPLDRLNELSGERDRIDWLDTTGLPGPSVLDWRVTDLGACLVTRAVPGVPADRLSPSELRRSWPAVTDAVRTLHDVPPAACPFDRGIDHMMARARRIVAAGRVESAFLPEELQETPPATILRRLEDELPLRLQQERADAVVCHGDLTLPNLLVDPASGAVTGFVDVGRLGRSDPYADLALLLATARETWEDDELGRWAETTLAERRGLDLDTDRIRFHLRLDPLTWWSH